MKTAACIGLLAAALCQPPAPATPDPSQEAVSILRQARDREGRVRTGRFRVTVEEGILRSSSAE